MKWYVAGTPCPGGLGAPLAAASILREDNSGMIKPDKHGDIELPLGKSQLLSCRVEWQNGCYFSDQLTDLSFACHEVEIIQELETCLLDLEQAENWPLALSFLGQHVTGCTVFAKGFAEVRFADGAVLKLLPNALYEGWQIRKQQEPKCLIISQPGGDFTLFNL